MNAEYEAAMAKTSVSQARAAADLASALDHAAETRAVADHLRELQPHIPDIIRSLATTKDNP